MLKPLPEPRRLRDRFTIREMFEILEYNVDDHDEAVLWALTELYRYRRREQVREWLTSIPEPPPGMLAVCVDDEITEEG